MTKAKKKATAKGAHGGRRPGTGRPALFRGKSESASKRGGAPMHGIPPKPISYLATHEAVEIMERNRERLSKELGVPRVSRSDFLEALVRCYGSNLNAALLRGVL